jgi:hypothetical protein
MPTSRPTPILKHRSEWRSPFSLPLHHLPFDVAVDSTTDCTSPHPDDKNVPLDPDMTLKCSAFAQIFPLNASSHLGDTTDSAGPGTTAIFDLSLATIRESRACTEDFPASHRQPFGRSGPMATSRPPKGPSATRLARHLTKGGATKHGRGARRRLDEVANTPEPEPAGGDVLDPPERGLDSAVQSGAYSTTTTVCCRWCQAKYNLATDYSTACVSRA